MVLDCRSELRGWHAVQRRHELTVAGDASRTARETIFWHAMLARIDARDLEITSSCGGGVVDVAYTVSSRMSFRKSKSLFLKVVGEAVPDTFTKCPEVQSVRVTGQTDARDRHRGQVPTAEFRIRFSRARTGAVDWHHVDTLTRIADEYAERGPTTARK
jgi:hypothetical protein